MSDHHHAHSGHSHTASGKNIRFAFFLNAAFACIELAGGLLTNSISILSDALHDFGDAVSLGVAWYLERYSQKERDAHYTYGYRRYSLLGAVFISVVLLVGAVFILRAAVLRLISPEEVHAPGMFALAVLGILVNGLAVLRLRKGGSLNEKAVWLHLMEDVYGWLAVLVVSVVMMVAHVPILDPLLSIGITIWVLLHVYRNLISVFRVFLQGVPEEVDMPSLEVAIQGLEGVDSIHDVHLWTMDGRNHVLSVHVVVSVPWDASACRQLKEKVRSLCHEHCVHHATIELEVPGEDCGLEDC